VAQIAAGERENGIWMTPADGSVRRFELDPMAYTADQAHPLAAASEAV